MAKSKKNRQADFQKVKLKVGKKLKKADNVTNTSFKTRKIQVSQKLKTGQETAPSTKKKQNIAELFTQCRHYSVSVRQEAITGLKELITTYPELVHAHLADLLEKTAELLYDRDPKVRQGSVRLLKTCLPKISEKLVSPFFPLLCAHLCCAMTHIVDEIQADSLSVLDILLEQYPRLIINMSNKVLSNFVEQISRRKGHGDGKRSLTSNPNSQSSSQKWRKSVFSRLHKFLSAMLKIQPDSIQSDRDMNELCFDMTFTSAKVKQLFPAYVSSQWERPGFILGTEAMDQGSGSPGQIGERLRDFATTLMPLMLECWVEAAPSSSFTADRGSQILPENAGAMYSVLQVTQALLEALDTYNNQEDHDKWPRQKYMKECQKHFLSNFPYDIYIAPTGKVDKKEKKEKTDLQEQVSADTLNLTICDIMSRFLPQPTKSGASSVGPPWLPTLTGYVTDLVGGKYNRGIVARSCRIMVKIVRRLIEANIDDASLAAIVMAMFQRYKGGHRLNQEKQTYLQFFARIMLECRDSSIVSSDMQEEFLKGLPGLLSLAVRDNQEMAALIVSVMKQAACQRCLRFAPEDLALIQQWFDPVGGIVLKLQGRERTGLMSVLYSLPEIGPDFTCTLAALARHEELTDSEAAFLIQCLQNRYIRSGEDPGSAGCHISLLCQLVFGLTKEEINQIVAEEETVVGGYQIIPRTDDMLSLTRHDFILQMVCGVLGQCRNSVDISSIMDQAIQAYLEKNWLLPVQVVYGICRFANLKLPCHGNGVAALSDLSVAALVFTLASAEPEPQGGDMRQGGDMTLGLQGMACSLIVALPGGLDVMMNVVQTKCTESTTETLLVLTKSCQLLVTMATERKLFNTCSKYRSILAALNSRTEQLKESDQENIPVELQRLLVELDYRLSTPPWT